MPYGFFTLEQFKTPRGKAAKRGEKPRWTAIVHFDTSRTISEIVAAIESRGRAGFYRVIQTQRMIMARKVDGQLHLRRWHAGRPETLDRAAKAFIRDGQRPPETPKAKKKTRHG